MFGAHPDVAMLLDARLAPRRRARLLHHVAECESCRRRYEELVEAERALRGDLDQASAAEIESMRTTVVAAATPTRKPRALWLGIPAVAASIAAVLLLWWRAPDEFVQRGEERVARASAQVFCQHPGVDEPTAASAGCARGSTLVPTFRLATPQAVVVHTWLQDAQGARHFFRGADSAGLSLNASLEEQVPELYLDLDASVATGAASLLVVLCERCDRSQALEIAAGDVTETAQVLRLPVLIGGQP